MAQDAAVLTGSVVTLDAAVLVVGCAARYEEAVGELALLLGHSLVVERPAPVRLTAVLLLWGRDRAGCGSGHRSRLRITLGSLKVLYYLRQMSALSTVQRCRKQAIMLKAVDVSQECIT